LIMEQDLVRRGVWVQGTTTSEVSLTNHNHKLDAIVSVSPHSIRDWPELRQLKGKRLFLLATGSTDEQLPSCMEEMVRLTAGYMKMEYLGPHYARFEKELDFEPETVAAAVCFLELMSGSQGDAAP